MLSPLLLSIFGTAHPTSIFFFCSLFPVPCSLCYGIHSTVKAKIARIDSLVSVG
ncbi:MAG: hypothetical protein F6J90_24475 [Moorea sp. SIOASIH]|uniref:hypothetical protein n=1 Tax=Moorena sp. SIOASIH TaxID=2607817 RepID=UPI0013B70C8B|nr:hypothetical protein [Moorena sp. SIOASIH]NEO39321.1 hypothetical protein [Moorena sp. SIOASIH]